MGSTVSTNQLISLRMLKIGSLIFLALTLISVFLLSANTHAAPMAKISKDAFDFGLVPQRAMCTRNFWVKNPGTTPLRISRIDAGCSCTQIPMPDSLIRPGDSVPLGITFSSGNFLGIISKRPKFWIEGDSTEYVLKVYSNVVRDTALFRPVLPTPFQVDISQFGAKERRRATFTLTNLTNLPYKISVADSDGKSVKVTVPKTLPPMGKVECSLIVTPEAFATDFKESITLSFSDPDATKLTIPYKRLFRPNAAPGTSSK